MELGAFRSQPTLGHPASDTNLSPRYPPYARPQLRLAVQSLSRFNSGVRRASLSPCAGPRHNQPSRRLRHECDASRDVLAGVLRTQNGPRCIQAAAGSCFAFAKRSVSRQIILRCRERMARTVACRTSIFWGRLPTSQRKTGAALRPRKSRGQSTLPGGVIAAPDGLPVLSSELPTSVATRATLHATHRPPMSSFCQITI